MGFENVETRTHNTKYGFQFQHQFQESIKMTVFGSKVGYFQFLGTHLTLSNGQS